MTTIRATMQPPNRRRGFTLVEALASIAILGILGGLAGSLLMRGMDGYLGVAVRSRLHSDLTATMDRVERALREIPASGAGAIPSIKSVTPTSIEWDESDGGATVALDGDSLLIGFGGESGTPMLEGVTSFTIRCFDESNAALADTLGGAAAESIRRIEVTITVGQGELTDTLRARVFLRCAMQGNG